MAEEPDIPETELSAEDKARKEAEARRLKILSKAGNRLDMVAGVNTTASPDNDGGDQQPSHHGDEAVDEGEKPAASVETSKSSKMAAMRRRRFKKGTATSSATAPAGTATKNEQGQIDDTTTTMESKDASLADTENKEEEPRVQEKEKVEKPAPESAVEDEEQDDNYEDNVNDDAPTKKKYMGVAKMRRKMIKERQAKEEHEGSSDMEGIENLSKATLLLTKKARKQVAVLPIAMHIITVLLLFFVGLDIGLQQSEIFYIIGSDHLTVHTQLAPQQGLRLVEKITQLATGGRGAGGGDSVTTAKIGLDQVVQDSQAYKVEMETDEFHEAFDEALENNVAGKEEGGNIDPLFQVDLDKYTRGPGLLMMAGRFAVACHRVNMSIFYYFPLRMAQRIQSTLQSLVQSPPTLCLLALAIRQFVGKMLLGAHLPEIVEDEAQGKDVASMVKNFVKSILLRAFPTAANLYDAWIHLRADMYVILCGLFFGIALHHQFGTSLTAPMVEDSVPEAAVAPPYVVVNTTPDIPGLSDEL